MLKILRIHQFKTADVRFFPNFRHFFPCFIQQIKLIFPLFLRYFQVFRNIYICQQFSITAIQCFCRFRQKQANKNKY